MSNDVAKADHPAAATHPDHKPHQGPLVHSNALGGGDHPAAETYTRGGTPAPESEKESE